MSLNIGWRQWDTYLKKFVDKEINCLEIGSYKGDATEKMLVHLSTNPKSRVYAVDTWAGSPEYPNMDFSLIEKEFDERMKKTGKDNQLIKMKMLSSKALMKLIQDKIMFDFIFIDASHEAKDVMSDTILSWEILKEGGIIIFDDYQWDKLKEEYSRPKLAIDSFISIYKPELKVLFSKYQLGIEKIKRKKVEVEDYYELINDILTVNNKFNYSIDMNINENIELDIKLSNNPLEYLSDNKYLNFIKKDYSELNKKYYNLELNRLLGWYKEYKLDNIFSNKIKDKIKTENKTPFEIIKKFHEYMGNNLENPVYEIISTIKNNNIIDTKNIKNISLVNFSHSNKHYNNLIQKFIKEKFNINNVKLYDINLTLGKNDEENIIKNKMYNCNEINNITKLLKHKIDIIIISLTSYNLIEKKQYNYEKYYIIQLFYQILFCLNNQNKNGCSIMISFTFFNDITIQLLFILKKYYKKLTFTNYKTNSFYTTSTKIIASGFKEIDKNELKILFSICDELKQEKYDDYDNKNYKYLNSIIKTNNNEYKIFKHKMVEINEKKIKYNYKNIKLWRDIIDFFEDEYNKNNYEKLKQEILKKQINIFYKWFVEYII